MGNRSEHSRIWRVFGPPCRSESCLLMTPCRSREPNRAVWERPWSHLQQTRRQRRKRTHYQLRWLQKLSTVLLICDKARAKPEGKGDSEKRGSLRERVQQISPDSGATLQWKFQTTAIQPEVIFFCSKRGSCSNSVIGFTSHLSRFFVALLVLPISENIRYKCIRKEEYYKVNIPSGEDKRKASYGNKTQLPCKCQTEPETTVAMAWMMLGVWN